MTELESSKQLKLLIVQRVLTPYRWELFNKLSPYFQSIEILSSKGDSAGAAKVADVNGMPENIFVTWLKSIQIQYKGESRGCSFFLYPQSIINLISCNIVLLEGTTNLINNIYLVPLAKMMKKKVVWWGSGYSPKKRTSRRKVIDFFSSIFISMTDHQIAYSSMAKNYMEVHMGARNCSLVLNTISTTYFESIRSKVIASISDHKFDASCVRLLYVGAVEKRKRVSDLILLVDKLNGNAIKYKLTIIGDGDYIESCKEIVKKTYADNIEFAGRIYDKEKLKDYYFNADLFVMPGDGGLAIAQSLLFGLPAVCVAADGTEHDYIDDKSYILNGFDELEFFLRTFSNTYNRQSVLPAIDKLSDSKFIRSLTKSLLN